MAGIDINYVREQLDEKKLDMVNHPPHYTGEIECINVITQQFGIYGAIAFCQGNAMKYIFRCEHKGSSVEDMKKAIWYLTKAIELKEKCEVK